MSGDLVVDADGHCREPQEGLAVTCEPEEHIPPYVLDIIGPSQVMHASDYDLPARSVFLDAAVLSAPGAGRV